MSEIKNPEREIKPAIVFSEKDFTDSGDELDNLSTESFEPKGRFRKEIFSIEKSHDASASQIERDLATKYVMPLQKMGDKPQQEGGSSETVRQPIGKYTSDEIQSIKAEREKIDMPDETTVMQKVICVATNNIKADLEDYLNPTNRNTGETMRPSVYGFVAKADDVAIFAQTPKECHDVLRLDYKGTPYRDPEQAVYVIRFTNGTNYEIPYSSEMGGTTKMEQPFTGSGYVGDRDHVIPEFKVKQQANGQGAEITYCEIYLISSNESEKLVAVFDKKEKEIVLINEEGKG